MMQKKAQKSEEDLRKRFALYEKDSLEEEKKDEKRGWYAEGLRFKCTGCGGCCTGPSGYVWVTEEEARRLADHLQLDFATFKSNYLLQIDGRLSLVERLNERGECDCIFFKDKRCTVYSIRPAQCSTFPWWQQNLESRQHWLNAKRSCEGIEGEDAPVISYEEIEEARKLADKVMPRFLS